MTHKAAAKFTAAQYTLADRLADRERGATALEYVGMLLVAAMVAGAVVSFMDAQDFGTIVKGAVNSVLNKGGDGG